MNKSRLALLAMAITSLSQAPVALSQQQETFSPQEQVQRIRAELEQLKEVNIQLYRRMQYLEGQLHQLAPPATAQQPAERDQGTRLAQEEKPAQRDPESARADSVRREPERSRAVEDLFQEEHTFFDQTFSLEWGLQYSHFDRSQLVLNGFLALDAIFLGNISIDQVDADIWTTSLTARWGLTDRLQLNARVPWVYRETKFSSGGQQLSSILVSEETVSDSDIGDVSFGLSYQLFRETPRRPDVVWNLSATAPTGRDPYGIKFLGDDDFLDPDSNTNLQIPRALPTGTGLWGISTGFSLLRTVDPGVLYASVSYTHYLEESFSDISSDPDLPPVPGDVQLGDRFRLGAGIAFALNERTNMSFGFSQEFFQTSKVKREGQQRQNIVGSKTTTGTLDIGVTYAMSNRLSVVGNLGVGLTQDSSDYTFSLRFPYRF